MVAVGLRWPRLLDREELSSYVPEEFPTPFLRCPTDNTVDVDNDKTVDDCEDPWDEATDDQRRFILIVIRFIKVQFIWSRRFLVQVRSFLGRRIEICLFSGFFYEWFQTNEDISWTDSAWPLVSCPSRVVILVNCGGATTRPPRLVKYSRTTTV